MSRFIDDDSFPETWKRTKVEQAEYDGWDSWDATYLDRTYSGAPDECSYHFIHLAEIVKMEKGICPRQAEHPHF